MAKERGSRNVLAESDDYETAVAKGSQRAATPKKKKSSPKRAAPLANAGKLKELNSRGGLIDYKRQFEGESAPDLLALQDKLEGPQPTLRPTDTWESNLLDRTSPLGRLHLQASIPENISVIYPQGELNDQAEALTMAGSALGALGGMRPGGVNYGGIVGKGAMKAPLQLGPGAMQGAHLGGGPLQAMPRQQPLQLPAHAGTELMQSPPWPLSMENVPVNYEPQLGPRLSPDMLRQQFQDQLGHVPQGLFEPAVAQQLPSVAPRLDRTMSLAPEQAIPTTVEIPQVDMGMAKTLKPAPAPIPREPIGLPPAHEIPELSMPEGVNFFKSPEELSQMSLRQDAQFGAVHPWEAGLDVAGLPEPDALTEALAYNNRSDMERLKELAEPAMAPAAIGAGLGFGVDQGLQRKSRTSTKAPELF